MRKRNCVVCVAVLSAVLLTAASAFAQSAPTQGYVLWSKDSTGQAALYTIDPSDGTIVNFALIGRSTGVGAGWKAVKYTPLSETTGYVLWTKISTGQSALWTINPTDGSWISSATIGSKEGAGSGWETTDYKPVGTSQGIILNNSIDPGADDGKDGDFFLNTTSFTLFGPKTAGAWGTGVSLVGPQGLRGEQGPKGDAGPQGPPGEPGNSPTIFRFAGITAQTFSTSATWLDFARACYSEFPGGKMATTEELKNTINPPLITSTYVWIAGTPPFVAFDDGGTSWATDGYIDAAGFVYENMTHGPPDIPGTAIHSSGKIYGSAPSPGPYPVACSLPISP